MAPCIERKLAAVMAIDVVGYGLLVGADEAGTLARVKAHRVEFVEPVIAGHRGRVVKLTGDGALADFVSVVDAVQCAVAIQSGMAKREAAESGDRRIRYRIGINIGDIVYDDGDIYGDGVNVAARLEGLADPGGICVARNVYNQVKNKLTFCFEPMGAHRVKNIAEPVEVYRVSAEPVEVCQENAGVGPIHKTNESQRADAFKSRWAALAAAAVVAIALAGASWWYLGQPGWQTIMGAVASGSAETKTALPLPDKPSIAVLPFDNRSSEPKQERLAAGITEDIITDLSRFRELLVIAPDSTEDLQKRGWGVRQVARDLRVQYVLRGSLQIDSDRVRVTAQLIDGRNGSLVWAEHYDESLDDIFAIQDEVTNEIAATLMGWDGIVARNRREAARRSAPTSLQVYDYYSLGMEINHNINEGDNEKALKFFQKALDVDPNYARPYVGIAWVTLRTITAGARQRTNRLRSGSRLQREPLRWIRRTVWRI